MHPCISFKKAFFNNGIAADVVMDDNARPDGADGGRDLWAEGQTDDNGRPDHYA
jgi:hypothetical protein